MIFKLNVHCSNVVKSGNGSACLNESTGACDVKHMHNLCPCADPQQSRGCNTYGTARRKFRDLHGLAALFVVWTLVGTDLRERLLRKFLSLSEPQGSMLAPPTQVCAQHKLQRFLAMLFSAECFQYRSARFCCIRYLQNSTSVELCRNVHVQIPAVPNTMN